MMLEKNYPCCSVTDLEMDYHINTSWSMPLTLFLLSCKIIHMPLCPQTCGSRPNTVKSGRGIINYSISLEY